MAQLKTDLDSDSVVTHFNSFWATPLREFIQHVIAEQPLSDARLNLRLKEGLLKDLIEARAEEPQLMAITDPTQKWRAELCLGLIYHAYANAVNKISLSQNLDAFLGSHPASYFLSKAREFFETATNRSNRSPAVLNALANTFPIGDMNAKNLYNEAADSHHPSAILNKSYLEFKTFLSNNSFFSESTMQQANERLTESAQRAADQDYAEAFYQLGNLMLEKNDEKKAISYFKNAAQNGHIDALDELGTLAFKKKNCKEGFQYFNPTLDKRPYQRERLLQILNQSHHDSYVLFNVAIRIFNSPEKLDVTLPEHSDKTLYDIVFSAWYDRVKENNALQENFNNLALKQKKIFDACAIDHTWESISKLLDPKTALIVLNRFKAEFVAQDALLEKASRASPDALDLVKEHAAGTIQKSLKNLDIKQYVRSIAEKLAASYAGFNETVGNNINNPKSKQSIENLLDSLFAFSQSHDDIINEMFFADILKSFQAYKKFGTSFFKSSASDKVIEEMNKNVFETEQWLRVAQNIASYQSS